MSHIPKDAEWISATFDKAGEIWAIKENGAAASKSKGKFGVVKGSFAMTK